MFFRGPICFLLGVVMLTNSGCGLQVGEKATQPSPIAYSGKGYNCVGQIPQHMQKYVNDELSDAEIADFMHCLQNAFSSFARYTRGRDQSSYAAGEIRSFLERSFLLDRTISDELLHEFMVIKQALIGGDSDHVARSELFTAIGFMDDLTNEAIRLRPHIKYLNPHLVIQQDPRDVGRHLEDANLALNQSINVIASRLRQSQGEYPLANLESFLLQFREFVNWEDHFKNAHPVEAWIALLKSFKGVTVSAKDSAVIHEEDWEPLLHAIGGWYVSYLQFEVGIKNQSIFQGAGLQNALYLVNEDLRMIRGAIQRQPTHEISFEQLKDLAGSMHELGWIPEKIRVNSIDQALRGVVTRMAGDVQIKPQDRQGGGLGLKSVGILEAEVNRWAKIQSDLDRRYKNENSLKVQRAPDLHGIAIDSKVLQDSDWDEFKKVEVLIRPLFLDGVPRVELIPNSQSASLGLHQGFYNLSLMNVLHSTAALIFRGYAENDSPDDIWSSTIRAPELQRFYTDFRDLGIDLAVVDKRNTNSGSRAFVEGKIFTSSSTGLNFDPQNPRLGTLGFVEAMEYFAYLYSGGQMANDVFSQLSAECPLGPLDLNGTPKVLRSCALGLMPAMVDQFMGNMPDLQKYLRQSAGAERLAYSKVILETAYSQASSDALWLEKNEVSIMTVVAHYAESVMIRFDRNQDGVLNNSELEDAVPIFSGFIKKIGMDKMKRNMSDAEARAAFFYILAYKSIPTSWWDFSYIYKNEWIEPQLDLDRGQLAEVFKAIIARLTEEGK